VKPATHLALVGLLALWGCATPSTGDGDADGDTDVDSDVDSDVDGDVEPTPCDDATDCDDGIECTEDLCSVGAVCRNEPVNSRCEGEEHCLPGVGCTETECENDGDCADETFCNGDEHCSVGQCFDRERDCDDGDACTRDWCDMATDRCAHETQPECSGDAGGDGSTDPFDPALHYSGSFRVVGIPRSGCGAATYNITRVTMTSTTDSLTVQAGSFPLAQAPRPTAGDFSVTYSQPSCGTYTLTGSFLNSDQFNARWTATFAGGCTACDPQDEDGVFGERE